MNKVCHSFCGAIHLPVYMCVVTEVDLSAVTAAAGGRLNNEAALHRRAVKPRQQRPLTQYQPRTQNNVDNTALHRVIVSLKLVHVSGTGYRCQFMTHL